MIFRPSNRVKIVVYVEHSNIASWFSAYDLGNLSRTLKALLMRGVNIKATLAFTCCEYTDLC